MDREDDLFNYDTDRTAPASPKLGELDTDRSIMIKLISITFRGSDVLSTSPDSPSAHPHLTRWITHSVLTHSLILEVYTHVLLNL